MMHRISFDRLPLLASFTSIRWLKVLMGRKKWSMVWFDCKPFHSNNPGSRNSSWSRYQCIDDLYKNFKMRDCDFTSNLHFLFPLYASNGIRTSEIERVRERKHVNVWCICIIFEANSVTRLDNFFSSWPQIYFAKAAKIFRDFLW